MRQTSPCSWSSVLVEQPLVQCPGVDFVGYSAGLLVVELLLVLLLFLVAQLVVSDALTLELERHRHGPERHQVLVGHRLIQFVGVCRYVILQVEQAIRISVDLRLGRGGESQQQRIVVVEDGPELLIHAAVGFVDDDQIKMPHAESLATVRAGIVDHVHHGRIGAEHDAGIVVFLLLDQVHQRRLGIAFVEGVFRLPEQSRTVGQKEDPADPVVFHQDFHAGNRQAGLAGAGGHHDQGRSGSVVTKALHDPASRFFVVIAVDDGPVDLGLGDVLARAAAVDHQLQLVAGVKALDRSRDIESVVPDPGFITVGVVDDRTLASHGFQAVGVQFRLPLARPRIFLGPLGFHDGQGQAVEAP